jgi:two-component system C4-dicarboxylate transport sensor histidine kinase DctB
LAQAHQRFARAVISLYVAATSVAIAVLVAGLVADRHYDEERAAQRLLLETQSRARYFGHHLRLLSEELRRLGLRSEINLLDDNLAPERSLLELAHEDSTIFNLGVAILDARGKVLWAQPQRFLWRSNNLGHTAWFMDMRVSPGVSIVAVDPDGREAVLYLVTPIVRGGGFTGAIVGGIDLSNSRLIEGRDPQQSVGQSVLTTQHGDVIYPATPPVYSGSTEWRRLFAQNALLPPVQEVVLNGRPTVIAEAPVGLAGFTLLTVADREALHAPAAQRLRDRLALGVAVALLPLVMLVYLFRRSLRTFRLSEEAAVREDRLKGLGEASNLIAHEVRNSLNGLRIGLDLVLEGKRATETRVVDELRAEIERLSSFTYQLMLFAKDPTPRTAPSDLSEIVTTALNLTVDLAEELGVEVEVQGTGEKVPVEVDAALIRIVISNLISNAIDALSSLQEPAQPPRVTVSVEHAGAICRVRVADNGPGVPPSLRHTLFEPFVTGKPSGVGIGLALARKIALVHGGDLRLEPSPRGASFVLELRSAPA